MEKIINTCLVQYSITLVAISIFVYLFYKYKTGVKYEKDISDKCKKCVKVKSLNSTYIIGILIGIIVLVVTYFSITKDEDTFVKYLSFASAISSIILAIIAIFMTVNFSGKSDEKLHDIKKASENITAEAKKINSTIVDFKNVPQAVKDATDRYELIAKKLSKSVEDIKDALTGIKEGQEVLTKNFLVPSENVNINISDVNQLIESCSTYGLISMYICCKSFATSKSFNFTHVFGNDDSTSNMLIGMSFAFNYLGIFRIDLDNKNNTKHKNDCIIANYIYDNSLLEKVEKQLNKYPENKYIQEHKINIDEFFKDEGPF